MIKYKTGYSEDEISIVEIVRETAKQVVVEYKWCGKTTDRKEAKRSSYASYFDTWKEAHDYLLEKAFSKVQNAETHFQRAIKNREKVEKLEE